MVNVVTARSFVVRTIFPFAVSEQSVVILWHVIFILHICVVYSLGPIGIRTWLTSDLIAHISLLSRHLFLSLRSMLICVFYVSL